MSTSTSLVQVPFHGDIIEAVQTQDGQILVHFKGVCDSLGVDSRSQIRKLRNLKWCKLSDVTSPDKRGRAQRLTMIPRECLPMWLATINPINVKQEIKLKLELYQCEAAAVLSAWFLGMSSARPDIERELRDIRSSLEHVERFHGIYKEKSKQLTADVRDRDETISELNQALELYRYPFQAERGQGVYMTLTEYCREFLVMNAYGYAIRGHEIRVESKRVVKFSNAFGVPCCKVEGGAFGHVNVYRIDVLSAWRTNYDLRNRVSEETYLKITRRGPAR